MSAICLYPENISEYKDKALQWAASFEVACYFDSNLYPDRYSAFDTLIAAGSTELICEKTGGSFTLLMEFLNRNKCWMPGFLSYDLKNELENLHSSNTDHLNFPDLLFFVPLHLILIRGNTAEIISPNAEDIAIKIQNTHTAPPLQISYNGNIKSRFSKQEYIDTVRRVKAHIARGDIYEMNLCQEFYIENIKINPLSAFNLLNRFSPAPFAAFFKYRHHFIISATPERFLARRGGKIISQPIKGTAARSSVRSEDVKIKEDLRNDLKEQSENVMIVDLVRNDLTKSSLPGSVEVEELFGVYSFPQVHQMISTVVCKADSAFHNTDIIKSAFPMGSMTGAPKVKAMELIEKYELTKRGVFSGAIGYFAPDGDFDFNVVIRSILYNEENRYLSFQTGGAITFASDPAKEYQECLLKAKAIFSVLRHDTNEHSQ